VFEMKRRMRDELAPDVNLAEFKQDLRDQNFMLLLDERRSVETIPHLLEGHAEEAAKCLEYVHKIVTAGGELSDESKRRLAEVERLFSLEGK